MAAFVKAIEQRRFKQAKLLLQLGDNVNQRETLTGRTPLLAMCFVEDENLACRITKTLLHRGADVGIQDDNGMTPLMQASKLGKEKLVAVLIASEECDLGSTDNEGNTALIHSVEAGNICITKSLTEAMNSCGLRAVDKANHKGETPLIRATKLQQIECTEILLRDGKASPYARDFDLKLTASEWKTYLNGRTASDIGTGQKMVNTVQREHQNVYGSTAKRTNEVHTLNSCTPSMIKHTHSSRTAASPTRLSMNVSEIHAKDDDEPHPILRRRTKSAPTRKENKRVTFQRSETMPLESSNAKGESGGSLLDETSPDLTVRGTRRNNGCLTKTGCSQAEPGLFTVKEGEGLVDYPLLTSSVPEQEKITRKNPCTKEGQISICQNTVKGNGLVNYPLLTASIPELEKITRKKEEQLGSCQNELPRLFSLLAQQESRSFRSSAKKRPSETPSNQKFIGDEAHHLRSSGRRNSRQSSAGMRRPRTSRRWSGAGAAFFAFNKFPSLYSRDDFTELKPPNIAMFEHPVTKERRSSVQSSLEDLRSHVKSVGRHPEGQSLSANLVSMNPDLSSSLPGRSSSNRIKSARPRYRRSNSDSFISHGALIGRSQGPICATPVIEEKEEADQ